MEELPPRRRWLPSPELLVFVGVGVVVSAFALPGLLRSQRASNERNASTMLKTLTSAEADFRANDRDENRINDFWTGDVSGLYYLKPANGGVEIRLIEADVANADAKPLSAPPSGGRPFDGFQYQALEWDDSVEGEKGNYRVDTDKSGRKVHNLERFGFTAFPAALSDGKWSFFVNENGTIFRTKRIQARSTYPSDEELKKLTCEDD